MTTDALFQNTISPAPSLYGQGVPHEHDPGQGSNSLGHHLHEGFYLLLLLKNGHVPSDASQFSARICRLLDDFERTARRMNVPADDVYAAKYAFCAAVDEAVLSSDMEIRSVWERSPLQLVLFGDQVAGENFFIELDEVRRRGEASVQALEVFYMCLLTGFQGKYMLDSKEKLNYLVATLDKEIAHLKGRRSQFAPHWKAPDNIRHTLKTDLPLWVMASGLALLGVATYAGLNWLLAGHTNGALAHYFDLIQLAPNVAHVVISLP